MGARANIVCVPAAFIIGNDVSAVLQHDPHAFDANWVAIERVGQITAWAARGIVVAVGVVAVFGHSHAPQQNGSAAVEVFAHQHTCPGNVGRDGGNGLRCVVCGAYLSAGAHNRDIPHRGGGTCGQHTQAECEVAPIIAHQRVCQDDCAETGGTALIPKTQRHTVGYPQCRNGKCAAIGNGQCVRHEIANRHRGLANCLGNLHVGADCRVKWNVNLQRWAIDQKEVFAPRPRHHHKWRTRQGLQRGICHCRRERVTRRWRNLKTIGSSGHAGKLKGTRRKGIKSAARVRHATATGNRGRVGTHAVVAKNLGRQTGRHIDHGNLRAVDGQTG